MTINEIVNKATTMGIELGNSPGRTIRFYVSKGLLPSPEIIYKGKIKQADYSLSHLAKLKLINIYKNRGLALDEIKNVMKSSIYLSNKGLDFIDLIRKERNLPNDLFQKGKPITRQESAYILYYFLEMRKNNNSIDDFVKEIFVGDNGEELTEFDQF